MSLKRKASHPAFTPPNGPALTAGLDDTPSHLNSRTRKRFRNDRPSDEVVYENTLRWLFSAQQQQAPINPCDEDTMTPEPLTPPDTIDTRQQTLLKFFKPSRPSSTYPPNTSTWRGDAICKDDFQHHALDMKSPTNSIATGGTNSPSSQRTDTDMEMDSGTDESAQDSNRWVGGLGWM